MRNFMTLLLLFIALNVNAQQRIKIAASNADCSNPVEIKDTLLIAENSPIGFGNDLEITDNSKDDTSFLRRSITPFGIGLK